MKGKRYTNNPIIGILEAHEVRTKVAHLVREYGELEQRFYCWKSKFGGMKVSQAKRLRELEQTNAHLKKTEPPRIFQRVVNLTQAAMADSCRC